MKKYMIKLNSLYSRNKPRNISVAPLSYYTLEKHTSYAQAIELYTALHCTTHKLYLTNYRILYWAPCTQEKAQGERLYSTKLQNRTEWQSQPQENCSRQFYSDFPFPPMIGRPMEFYQQIKFHSPQNHDGRKWVTQRK